MSIFYKPPNAFVGDVIPFFDDGLFKPFYLKIWRDYRGPDRIDGWHMLTTADHLSFSEHPTGIHGGTGSVLKIDGIYHMFYCKFDHTVIPMKQMACHATSTDLLTWTEHPEDTFMADGEIYEMSDWRDPFVFWVEAEQQYWMLLAAQKRGRTMRKGCVAKCVSTDLKHWRYEKPLYAPGVQQSALECPDLFQMGGWYYLIYSAYTDRFQTLYRMSRSLNGPWITPKVDTFDTRAFYAAKTGTDGARRFLYAWNPTREYNLWNFNPLVSQGHDYDTWDWGGSMVVHQLHQNLDGTLAVCAPQSVENAFGKERTPTLDPLNGFWQTQPGFAVVDSPDAYACALLPQMPHTARLDVDMIFSGSPREFGIALQVDECFDLGYYLCFEPHRQRLQFKSGLRMFEDGGKMFPYEVEMERPLDLHSGEVIQLKLFCEGSILEVYVNQQIALSTRMFNLNNRRFGLFVAEGQVNFTRVRLFTPGLE